MYKEKLRELLECNPGCEVIFLTKFGSQLYGTDTPESDLDIKGVFIPSKSMMYLGEVPKSIQTPSTKGKNTKDDVDIQLYSIQYFFKLAKAGDTNALDMLHSSGPSVLQSSLVWEDIHDNRRMFYTKNLKAFIGYAKKQANVYGIKGERLDSIDKCINLLNQYFSSDKLMVFWDSLPQDNYSKYIGKNQNGIQQYMICGKILQETMTVDYAFDILNRYRSQYGDRALVNQKNSGVDWKAISHALRAAFEVWELLTYEDIKFPLKVAPYLLEVKQGKRDYSEVMDHLEDVLEDIDYLTITSKFPDVVDSEACDLLLLGLITDYYRGK